MNTTFGVGNVLATGFRIWFKNVVPFLLITALLYAPLWLWALSATLGEPSVENLRHLNVVLTSVAGLSWLINTLVSAALIYGVVMELQGQRASFGACIGTGIARFFPALGVGLLTTLCVAGGTLLLVIPGIIVWCMLYVAMPASVLERPGLLGALRRSRELTRGHKMEIFGLAFLLGLITFFAGLIVGLATDISASHDLEETFRGVSRHLYLQLVSQMVTGSITATMSSVAYYFLRAEKEGTSAAELAAIFD